MPDTKQTMARLGYANMIDAVTVMDGDLPIEIGLIGPGTYGDRYAVAIHYDCDPANPTQGSSELDDGFTDLESARRAFQEAVAVHRRDT